MLFAEHSGKDGGGSFEDAILVTTQSMLLDDGFNACRFPAIEDLVVGASVLQFDVEELPEFGLDSFMIFQVLSIHGSCLASLKKGTLGV